MSPTELLFFLLVTLFSYFPLLISRPQILNRHICSRIMSGAFESIHLISMTYDTDNNDATGLFIFQSDDRLYRIPLAKVFDDFIDLQDVKYIGYHDEEKIRKALEALPTADHLKTIYTFQTKAPGAPDFLAVHGVFMVTDQRRYMFIRANMLANELRMGKSSTELEEFSIVHTQKKNTVFSSYAIHRDIYNHTGDFIIYQIALDPKTFSLHHLQHHDASPKAKDSARFYYLEKTANASTVKFVHRHNFHYRNAGYQLFEKQPVGFLHRATGAMILFDTALGCVYHFYEWNEEILWKRFQDGSDFEAKRRNYPFELFFLCDQKLYPKAADFAVKYKADRCETIIGSSKLKSESTSTEKSESTSIWILVGISTVVIVLASVIICLIKWPFGRFKGKFKNPKTLVMNLKDSKTTILSLTGTSGSSSRKPQRSKKKGAQQSCLKKEYRSTQSLESKEESSSLVDSDATGQEIKDAAFGFSGSLKSGSSKNLEANSI